MNLEMKAFEVRKSALEMIYNSGGGHLGGDMSCADILTVLYFYKMNISVENIDDINRDRYVQSKGHCVESLWAVLYEKGFISKEDLDTFSQYNTKLIGHPNNKVKGIEMNTGSLGHGLPVCVGIALAAKLDGLDYQTYTLMGDGELAEGSVWEGAMAAANYKLDNLTAIIDRNQLQISGNTEDVMALENLSDKWKSFGWQVLTCDGNDIDELKNAFDLPHEKDKPKVIIANTIKGFGIKIAENKKEWHHKVPTKEQYEEAIKDFNVKIEELNNEQNS